MSEKMIIHIVCDGAGVPMRAFEDEGAAKAYRFTLKKAQPQANYSVVMTELYGPLGALAPAASGDPDLYKIHVVLDKDRNPDSAFVLYDAAKRQSAVQRKCTRAPLILDRSKFDE